MNYYIDFEIKPDEVLTKSALLSALFSHLHLALVEEQRNDVGLSFPRAGKTLGTVMRAHGGNVALTTLLNYPGLDRLRDYYQPVEVITVPDEYSWCTVSRRQPAITHAKARRMIKRGTLSAEEAYALIQKRGKLNDPYITIKSKSSGQQFNLFIVQKLLDSPPKLPQTFNSYGLGGSVPWF